MHQKRCETCRNYVEDDDTGTCASPVFIEQGLVLILGQERYDLIELVGCASWIEDDTVQPWIRNLHISDEVRRGK